MAHAERLMTRLMDAVESDTILSMQDVLMALSAGKAQAFVKNESVVLTEICESFNGKYLNIWAVAGDMEDVIELQRIACDSARKIGCTKACFTGRRGWERHPATAAEGWRVLNTGFIKDLGEQPDG